MIRKEPSDVILKKSILISFSTVLIALGITLFLQSRLGSDPITVWIDGLRLSLALPMGTASLYNNLVMLALAILFARKYIHIGTVIGAVVTGPLMNLFDPVIYKIFGADPRLGTRIGMMLLGQVVLCYAIALNLSVKFGFGTVDSLLVRLCEKFRLKYKVIKMLSDLIYTIAGILLGGVFGFGSVISVLTGGPLIAWFMEKFTEPMAHQLHLNENPIREE